ncbi:AraD1 family protein [Chthonobacter rhizosphaerae]|uniref:AraD1 family protein n=1 Tax=Chthonobacter rhizosphaerae TaxID=2735553 RepID=UPI0015EF9EBB|nr:AraD1 family protein [Chthonobacter rhizosphaerae]
MRLSQFRTHAGERRVAAVLDDGSAVVVPGVASVYALALEAIAAGQNLAAAVSARAGGAEPVDLEAIYRDGRMLTPLDHPDPAHIYVTGTGLTHLGSAEGRDKMHKDLADPAKLTDSMRMFKKGIDGGKPAPGQTGVAPEWFYKGDGSTVVPPGGTLPSPSFALDAGEEPEIVGLYVIGPDGTPHRVGFALGNEFSDHVTERENYLYLAHSKLRASSFGPEILVGPLPAHVSGFSRILRDGGILWQKPFVSGEDNMCHSIANLEHHHFKYGLFRRPGDVHVHYFGTATLSFSDGVKTEAGDVFEIAAPPFGLPLRNAWTPAHGGTPAVRAL